ncbi:MAG: hypothetical protein IJY44_03890 [Bacteroidaceae bacterium]|nr:hypothetical protein [Bacteroidaceae bacterium]
MKKHILIILSAVLFFSCAGISHISTPRTVAINQGNFKFVKNVSTSSTAVYVLGIGGLTKKANADIVEKLIEEAQLKPNQALADYRIKTTNKIFLGIIVIRELTASASVVEFCDIKTNTFSACETPNVDSLIQSEREAKLSRLFEINKLLSNGLTNDIDSTKIEINEIEQWYNKNGYYKPLEWNEIKKAKEFIQNKNI